MTGVNSLFATVCRLTQKVTSFFFKIFQVIFDHIVFKMKRIVKQKSKAFTEGGFKEVIFTMGIFMSNIGDDIIKVILT